MKTSYGSGHHPYAPPVVWSRGQESNLRLVVFCMHLPSVTTTPISARSPKEESNPRQAIYKIAALPLSYKGKGKRTTGSPCLFPNLRLIEGARAPGGTFC